MRLQDRVAIVTGGARGIGAGIARCLAEEGAKVAILDIDGEPAIAMAAELGPQHRGYAADVSREAIVRPVIDQVVKDFGRLDILVNNAGGGNRKAATASGPPFTRVEEVGWDEQMAINLRTVFASTKCALPHLKQQQKGSIINISSIAGLTASPGMPAYAAAKSAVLSLTRSLALELGRNDIRVNAICPGFLYTRAWKSLATSMQRSSPQNQGKEPYDVFVDMVKSQTPLGREQTPEDIGKLTAFLCSDDARNITGQIISVDGGQSL